MSSVQKYLLKISNPLSVRVTSTVVVYVVFQTSAYCLQKTLICLFSYHTHDAPALKVWVDPGGFRHNTQSIVDNIVALETHLDNTKNEEINI